MGVCVYQALRVAGFCVRGPLDGENKMSGLVCCTYAGIFLAVEGTRNLLSKVGAYPYVCPMGAPPSAQGREGLASGGQPAQGPSRASIASRLQRGDALCLPLRACLECSTRAMWTSCSRAPRGLLPPAAPPSPAPPAERARRAAARRALPRQSVLRTRALRRVGRDRPGRFNCPVYHVA